MKHFVIACAVLCAVQPAMANDWSGWHAGVDAGYVQRDFNNIAGTSYKTDGAFAGVSGGYWWQTESVVFGFDAGLTLGGADFHITQPAAGFAAGFTYSTFEAVSTSLRIKVGAEVGPAIAYAAIGPQYVHSTSTMQWTGSSLNHDTNMEFGYTLSVGAETKLSKNISLKAEYGMNMLFPNQVTDTKISGQSAKIGLNYYFN